MTVQTHPHVTRDLRLAARQGLLPAKGGGWYAGFGNMLGKELGEWFRTRRLVWQLLIWLTVINGSVAFFLFAVPLLYSAAGQAEGALPPEVLGFVMFFSIAVMGGSIGIIILAQDE